MAKKKTATKKAAPQVEEPQPEADEVRMEVWARTDGTYVPCSNQFDIACNINPEYRRAFIFVNPDDYKTSTNPFKKLNFYEGVETDPRSMGDVRATSPGVPQTPIQVGEGAPSIAEQESQEPVFLGEINPIGAVDIPGIDPQPPRNVTPADRLSDGADVPHP